MQRKLLRALHLKSVTLQTHHFYPFPSICEPQLIYLILSSLGVSLNVRAPPGRVFSASTIYQVSRPSLSLALRRETSRSFVAVNFA